MRDDRVGRTTRYPPMDPEDVADLRVLEAHDIKPGATHCKCGERIISYGPASRMQAVREHRAEAGCEDALQRMEKRARSAAYRPQPDAGGTS